MASRPFVKPKKTQKSTISYNYSNLVSICKLPYLFHIYLHYMHGGIVPFICAVTDLAHISHYDGMLMRMGCALCRLHAGVSLPCRRAARCDLRSHSRRLMQRKRIVFSSLALPHTNGHSTQLMRSTATQFFYTNHLSSQIMRSTATQFFYTIGSKHSTGAA